MRYTLRSIAPDASFADVLTVDLFAHLLPTPHILQALTTSTRPQQRVRKLSHVVTFWLIVAMNLWTHLSIEHVFQKLTRGLRFIWPDPIVPWPGRSAFCYRRSQLGVKPFVTLFHQHCRPLATPTTVGAFLFGYRVMAIDGTIENVADTPLNAAAFGRMSGSRGASAFPQIRAVYLVECGTHAIVDAGVWPCCVHERIGGYRMLRSLQPDMLVMWDRGFHSYSMVEGALARGAQILARLSLTVNPPVRQIYRIQAIAKSKIPLT